MTREVINSVGIDVGTSTTELVFSRLTIENLAGPASVPRISITEKQIAYRSAVHTTPTYLYMYQSGMVAISAPVL